MEQNNNELVLYNERGELVECNFQRVDFNNPPSILSYGDEVKEAITNILNSTAQIAVSSEEYKINDSLIRGQSVILLSSELNGRVLNNCNCTF